MFVLKAERVAVRKEVGERQDEADCVALYLGYIHIYLSQPMPFMTLDSLAMIHLVLPGLDHALCYELRAPRVVKFFV